MPYFMQVCDFWSHFTLFWSFLCDLYGRSFSDNREGRHAEVVIGKRTQSCHHVGDVIRREVNELFSGRQNCLLHSELESSM